MPAPTPREALTEGLSDAIGFVLGALAGWQLGRLLGFDALAPGDFDVRSGVGVVFVMLGCGVGKWAATRWRTARKR